MTREWVVIRDLLLPTKNNGMRILIERLNPSTANDKKKAKAS